jgi:hypothetical protein
MMTGLGSLLPDREEAASLGADFVKHGILHGTGHKRFLDSPTSYYELPSTRYYLLYQLVFPNLHLIVAFNVDAVD